MPGGRGDWRPMSSGADVSRTPVDRGRGQGRSCHRVWVMPIEEASLQRQDLGKTVAMCRCGLLCCKPLVEEYQFKGSWNIGSSAQDMKDFVEGSALEPGCPGSAPRSVTSFLCDLGHLS